MGSLSRVVLVPGNGCDDIMSSNWYGLLYEVLRERHEIHEVICQNMPDSHRARASIWLPFMKDVLKIDKDTIAIGHSCPHVGAILGLSVKD